MDTSCFDDAAKLNPTYCTFNDNDTSWRDELDRINMVISPFGSSCVSSSAPSVILSSQSEASKSLDSAFCRNEEDSKTSEGDMPETHNERVFRNYHPESRQSQVQETH